MRTTTTLRDDVIALEQRLTEALRELEDARAHHTTLHQQLVDARHELAQTRAELERLRERRER